MALTLLTFPNRNDNQSKYFHHWHVQDASCLSYRFGETGLSFTLDRPTMVNSLYSILIPSLFQWNSFILSFVWQHKTQLYLLRIKTIYQYSFYLSTSHYIPQIKSSNTERGPGLLYGCRELVADPLWQPVLLWMTVFYLWVGFSRTLLIPLHVSQTFPTFMPMVTKF